jgi:hypothetical protein
MKSDNDGLVFCGRIIFVVLIRSPRHDPLYDIALCVPWRWTHLCLIQWLLADILFLYEYSYA